MLHVATTWFHLLAVLIWIGGLAFMATVMVPTVRGSLDPAQRGRFMGEIGRRFRLIAWIAVLVIVLTGFINIFFRVEAGGDIRPFMRLLTVKLALVLVLLGLTALHDFILAPKMASQVSGQAGSEADRATRMRRVSWLPRISLLLGLVVIFLGLAMSHL